MVATGNDGQFVRFVTLLGAPDLATDPRFLGNAARVAQRQTLVPILTGLTLDFTMAGLLGRLDEAGIPAGPINDLQAVFSDPHSVARGMEISVPDAHARGGFVPGLRLPILMHGQQLVSPRASPRLDADRADILSDAGWNDAGKDVLF